MLESSWYFRYTQLLMTFAIVVAFCSQLCWLCIGRKTSSLHGLISILFGGFRFNNQVETFSINKWFMLACSRVVVNESIFFGIQNNGIFFLVCPLHFERRQFNNRKIQSLAIQNQFILNLRWDLSHCKLFAITILFAKDIFSGVLMCEIL